MSFSAINLSNLPAPVIIEQLDFEAILAARKARLLELAPELAAALELESEPLVKLLQEDSYREMVLRREINDAAQGNMLAFATGAALEHLAALYGVTRQVVQIGDADATPPIPEIMEDDTRLRKRVQLAPEGFTTAGSIGSYLFWGLSASTDVKDIAVSSANPGQVLISVLSTVGDGTASAELLTLVEDTIQPRRPLTDWVVTSSAAIQTYTIDASLTLYDGPDSEVVRQAAQSATESFVRDHHLLGHDITIAGLHGALVQAGVQNVVLNAPIADLLIGPETAAFCTDISIVIGGRDV